MLLKAQRLARADRPSEALALLHSFLERSPQAVELRRLKILVAIKAQRSEEALSDYGAVSDAERHDDPALLRELSLGLINDALWSDEGLIRARAAAALAELADLSARPLLQRGMEHPDPSVRAHAVETAGRLGNPAFQRELEQRLHDPDPFVRAAAAWALGRLGQPSSQPLLRHTLLDRHAHVKVRAAGALALLGDRSALPSLTGALEAKDAA
ncbi:MAG: HEAT repeat domain-containing protein, partial [Candidatus Methylomirabilaceae bacterium]